MKFHPWWKREQLTLTRPLVAAMLKPVAFFTKRKGFTSFRSETARAKDVIIIIICSHSDTALQSPTICCVPHKLHGSIIVLLSL
jgi:hypothetical protein